MFFSEVKNPEYSISSINHHKLLEKSHPKNANVDDCSFENGF